MNLVMIGRFKESSDAEGAKRLIGRLIKRVASDRDMAQSNTVPGDRFTNTMLELLKTAKVYTLSPAELEQLLYDAHVNVEDNKVIITTDGIDVSAFLKVLLEKGARIEMYSAHNYPDTDCGH